MRVRAAALVLFALALSACSGKQATTGSGSLRLLSRLSADQKSFGVILDAASGKALAAFRVDSPLRAAVDDGDGGWYVGGGFMHVNGKLRKRLAHVRADGSLDPEWKPGADGNGVSVTSLVRIGSRLYVAGDFAQLERVRRPHLGALEAGTGELLPWRPDTGPFGPSVLLGSRDALYVGGYGGAAPGSGLIALDPETGRVVSRWHGRVDTSDIEGGSVRVLISHRDRIYLAGMFKAVDGVARPGLAAVAAASGALASDWNPPLSSPACLGCTEVSALAAGDGVVYAGTPGRVHALDAVTGALDRRWSVQIDLATGIYGGAGVAAIATSNSRLYLAGTFDRIGGDRHRAIAAVDASTGQPQPVWTPKGGDAWGTLLSPSGSRLLLGIEMTRTVRFDVAGLEAIRQPVKDLDLVLALGGRGSVRVGIGRTCDYRRWAETGRCYAPVTRWLARVRFRAAARKRFRHALPLPPGRYFVRFLPRALSGPPQPPYDLAFRH